MKFFEKMLKPKILSQEEFQEESQEESQEMPPGIEAKIGKLKDILASGDISQTGELEVLTFEIKKYIEENPEKIPVSPLAQEAYTKNIEEIKNPQIQEAQKELEAKYPSAYKALGRATAKWAAATVVVGVLAVLAGAGPALPMVPLFTGGIIFNEEYSRYKEKVKTHKEKVKTHQDNEHNYKS